VTVGLQVVLPFNIWGIKRLESPKGPECRQRLTINDEKGEVVAPLLQRLGLMGIEWSGHF
jgi:hypothetical protein